MAPGKGSENVANVANVRNVSRAERRECAGRREKH